MRIMDAVRVERVEPVSRFMFAFITSTFEVCPSLQNARQFATIIEHAS